MKRNFTYPALGILAMLILSSISFSTAALESGITVDSPSITVVVDNSFVRVTTSLSLTNNGQNDSEYTYKINIPDDAFLTNLTAAMNGTLYYGQVKEDAQAQQEYDEAVEAGKSAIKIEKYSVTSFSMTLNLLPGKPMDISFRYHQFLVKELGGYNLAVTPADLLPSGLSSDVQVGFTINSNTMITSADVINLGTGEMKYQGTNSVSSSASIPSSAIGNEIIFTYGTRDTGTNGLMQFHSDGEMTYFVHTFAPGMESLGNRAVDKDIVFIVDRSGSMSGDKMTQTKEAFELIVDRLSSETDRFNIISFSSGYELWKNDLQVPGTDEITDAKKWINNLAASGGTNIIESLEKGLEIFDGDSSRMKIIVFLTDGNPTAGDIKSPEAICSTIKEKNSAKKVSIFSLGVGYDMDFQFLKKLSFLNYARAYRIDDSFDISEQISYFYDTISTPLIYRLNMNYENAANVYQRQAPYMFKGQEHLVLGEVIDVQKEVKFSGTGITVNGTTTFSGDFASASEKNEYIAQLWAFMHIRWCEEQMVMGETPEQQGNATGDSTWENEITYTAVKFQIVTDYTTMIVVVEEEVKAEEEDDDDGDPEKISGPPDENVDSDDSYAYDGGGDSNSPAGLYDRQSSKYADEKDTDGDGAYDGIPISPPAKESTEEEWFTDGGPISKASYSSLMVVALILIVGIIITSVIVVGVMKSRKHRDRNLTGMRRDIYEYIKHNPGEHLSNIKYEFDTSPSTITYHLGLLEKDNKIIGHKDTKFKRYYANVDGVFGGGDLRETIHGLEYKDIVSALKSDSAVKIVRYIMEHPGCTQKAIAKDVGINSSTVNWHINKLRESNLVDFTKIGKSNSYTIPEAETVSRTIEVLNGNT